MNPTQDRWSKARRGMHRADELVGTPYVWDGGHRGFAPDHGEDPNGPKGEDCSGFACDVMEKMGILRSPFPLNTTALKHWGLKGAGELFTLLVIDRQEISHCLLRFTLPEFPKKHLIAARHTGTTIQWYPADTSVHIFLTEGYEERRWAG